MSGIKPAAALPSTEQDIAKLKDEILHWEAWYAKRENVSAASLIEAQRGEIAAQNLIKELVAEKLDTAQSKNERLERENIELTNQTFELEARDEKMRAEIVELREALEFYANEHNYYYTADPRLGPHKKPVIDLGNRARAALSKEVSE